MMDWYQEQWRKNFGDDEWSHALWMLSLVTWCFPWFALLFVLDEAFDEPVHKLLTSAFRNESEES